MAPRFLVFSSLRQIRSDRKPTLNKDSKTAALRFDHHIISQSTNEIRIGFFEKQGKGID